MSTCTILPFVLSRWLFAYIDCVTLISYSLLLPSIVVTCTCALSNRSRAIARYLATKAKASHVIPLADDPDYLKKLAKFETAASIEYSNFDPLASGIAFQKIFKQMKVRFYTSFCNAS